MTSISDGTTTITPELVLGYRARTASRNVVHPIIGRAAPDVSLTPDTLRNGTLELLFATAEDAWAAHALHSAAAVFTIEDDDVAQVGMTYTRAGDMEVELDSGTLVKWVLRVGFQEVAA